VKQKLVLGLILGAGVLLAQHPGGTPMNTPTTQPESANNPNSPLNNGNTPSSTVTRVDDKKFAEEAATGGLAEVQFAKLAQEKASSDAVKQFAQKMIDDHTKADDQLQQVASKGNLTLPDRLQPKQQEMLDKLSKLSGPAFDKAYAKDMVKDHEKDISEFRAESQMGSVPQIKQFAADTLPVIEQHLELAKTLDKTVKKESK
jgi:putative membrane protein